MKIPKKLKIGGHIIKVRFTEDIGDDAQADSQKNEILIDPRLPVSQQGGALVHEVFHHMNSTLDHTLLASLSEQWWQVLSDNKLLK